MSSTPCWRNSAHRTAGPRDGRPGGRGAGPGWDQSEKGGTAVDPDARARLDQTMTQIAHQTGATLHACHHPGRAARRVVLRDARNDRGTQAEAAQLEADGTLRVTGHHTGPGVSEFSGDAITCYD